MPARPMDRAIRIMSKEFAHGPGDRHSSPGRVIPKTQKIVLVATLLNTQQGWISALPYTSV